jgi:hypothetical protein
MNAVEIEQVITELVARPFDRAEFAYDFLEAVGNKPVTIGVTGQSVENRIGNAELDPTFMMADVAVVATYKLLKTKLSKFEAVIHRPWYPHGSRTAPMIGLEITCSLVSGSSCLCR